ncbi:MAG TPA: BlaI/MecI/CopY family transcriptional regulator [Bacteroidetes bacterium]|nr:BlaI/MecI/CopY family transcriptional regulator [Bacteroidota bacterium]HIL58229.1 BlaI/MecI/CopY family transcriptional regulator [Rhodothermales bacterium]
MRNPLTPLGGTEMEVLRHVWDLGTATVRDVHDRIRDERRIAYTTVMTVMKNLAEKGYLSFERDGQTYVYRAERRPEEVRGTVLSGILDKVFGGDPASLVQTLVQADALSDADRDRLRQIIDGFEDDAPQSNE